MGDGAKTLLGDKLPGLATYAVSLVLDADQGILQVLDELHLPLREMAGLLL